MFRQWLRLLRPSHGHPHPTRRPPSFVPRVESLEGRDVPSVTVITSGLEGSQGSAVGPGGALYVTEGIPGRLSRVDPDTGAVTTVVTGLPTGPWAGFGGGAVDVAFHGDTPYVLVVDVAFDVGGTDVVGIYRVDGPTSFTVIADIGTWSVEHPPATDFFLPTGNGYAIESYRGGFLVTDGHHNRVLEVGLDGSITEVIAFANVAPTGLEVRGNTIYVAQAGPVPHLPANGKVVSFERNSPVATTVAAGAPLLTDVEFGRGNTLYALSMGVWVGVFEGDPPSSDTGAFLRVNSDGTFTALEEDLDRPTSLEFIRGAAYVVTFGGEVLRIDSDNASLYSGRSGGTRKGDSRGPAGPAAVGWGPIDTKVEALANRGGVGVELARSRGAGQPASSGDAIAAGGIDDAEVVMLTLANDASTRNDALAPVFVGGVPVNPDDPFDL